MADKTTEEIYDMFLQESFDLFEVLNKGMLTLENNPQDEETLYSILRVVHSLKGSAGMLRFQRMQELCHKLEDFVEIIHGRPDMVNQEIMDFLFSGGDIIQGLFIRSMESDGGKTDFSPSERNFLDQLDRLSDKLVAGSMDLHSAVHDLLDKTKELLESVEDFYDTSSIQKSLGSVKLCLEEAEVKSGKKPRAVETFLLNGTDVAWLLNALQPALDMAKETKLGQQETEAFFAALDKLLKVADTIDDETLKASVKDIRESVELFAALQLDFDSLQSEYYAQALEDIKRFRASPPPPKAAPAKAKPETENAAAATHPQHPDKLAAASGGRAKNTVRIEDAKIDAFLNSVGEMIILGEVFNHLQKRLALMAGGNGILCNEFKNANKSFSNHIFSLQKALMDVRRVAIKNITSGLPRLARDTAKKLNKKIRVDFEGEDAVIDKSLLDDVRTSVIHIVRNAVDHGLEPPAERLKAGKPEEGRILVKALNDGDHLVISISDDGRGIDTAKLRTTAVAKGLISQAEADAMGDTEARRLIFYNGFSTATDVSDVSGRGVGMSVVIENINKAGGAVNLASQLGRGTEITMKIPLSVMLSVLDAFIVRVANETFAIPIRFVLESFSPTPTDFLVIQGKGECVMLRGDIHRLKRMRDFFDISAASSSKRDAICVLVAAESERFCLLVDEIVEHQQVVIKEINGLGQLPGILGGAMLGDGTIGLVMDIEAMSVRAKTASNPHPQPPASLPAPTTGAEPEAEDEAEPEAKDFIDDDSFDEDLEAMSYLIAKDTTESQKRQTRDNVLYPVDLGDAIDPAGLADSLGALIEGLGELKQTMLLNNIRDFGETLKALGQTHNTPRLTEISDLLLSQVDSFDADSIPSSLDAIGDLIGSIIDSAGK